MSFGSSSQSSSSQAVGFLNARLVDIDAVEVRVLELVASGPAVLVFVRHFGCMFCRQQVADLATRRSELQARGADPIIIGHGSVEQARAFARRDAAGMRVLTDPTREVFCAAGMKRGIATSVRFGVVRRAAVAIAQGHLQTSLMGDPFQQGGAMVLDQGGRELYRFVSEEAGLNAPLDEVIAALPARAA